MSIPKSLEQNFNQATIELIENSIPRFAELGINLIESDGAKVLDFAIGRAGSIAAGVLLGEICMGTLATIECVEPAEDLDLHQIKVSSSCPLLACIGSQYAGWPLSYEKYFAMCSGPMRLLRGKEAVLAEYDLHQTSDVAVGVLESNEIPGPEVLKKVAEECGVNSSGLWLCIARTASNPGALQVVARSIETAMHKLHELKFDLGTIVEATGRAPLPPIPEDDMTALGWTNDSMLYGASVELHVDTEDDAVEAVLEKIPSSYSQEFGLPFLEIFNRYDKDFYKIDKMLFSPAAIEIFNRRTNRRFEAGKIRNDILKSSFGIS